MTLGLIFLIILFSLVLIKSADLIIIAIRRIAKSTHVAAFTISAIILALGTSLPELFVSVTSALEGTSNLSLGVIIGSNIANIALIGATTALIAGRVIVHGNYLRREIVIAALAGILPIFLASDGVLNRVDALILIIVYLAYATGFFKERYVEIGKQQQEESFVYRFMRKFEHIESVKTKEFGRLFVGIALMIFSADTIVKLSKLLAAELNIPIFVIGLFVLAIGTSLPEFAFSLRTLEDGEPSMFFGNLLGSTIANSTLVVGVATLIRPAQVQAINEYYIAAGAFLMIFAAFTFFSSTKHRLDRWEAMGLLVLYISFLILEVKGVR